jgi:hypothetical protein
VNLYSQGYKDSLIAYWSFEDSTARDFSGNGYDGVMMNVPRPCLGIVGGTAMQFWGKGVNESTGSHIILPMIDFESFGDFSYSLWVKEDSISYKHGEAFIFFGDHHQGWLGIMNILNVKDPTGNPTQYIQAAVGAGLSTKFEPTYIDLNEDYIKQWMFICVTYDNQLMSVYINGELKEQKSQPISIVGDKSSMARHWWSTGMETSTRFFGQLDEVKIFKKALTPDEVKEEYEENTCPTFVPELISSNGTFFCEGDSTILSVKGKYRTYKWSNGQTCESISVGHWGVYSVEVTDTNGCMGNQSILIEVLANPNPNIIINENKVLCDGDSVNIGTDKVFKEYFWESGQKTRSIYVKNDGWYKVIVTDEDGCSGTDSIYVDFKSNQKPEIKVDAPSLCQGDSVIMTSVNNYVQYQWLEEPNETLVGTEKVFITHKSGRYKLRVVTADGCVVWSDPIEVTISNKQNVLEVIGSGGNMPDEVVFGDNRIGKISCKDITIVNHGSQTITINQLSPKENIFYSIPQGQLPIILEPGGRKEIKVCFLPDSAGEFRDTIELGDLCNNHHLKLYGICGETYYSGSSRCGFTIKAGLSKTGNITVYPNPSSGILNLSFDAKASESYIIKATSPEGREVYNYTMQPASNGRLDYQIDMQSLPSGPYRISIYAPDWIEAYILMLIK